SLHQIDSVMNNAAGVCKLDLELQLDERDDGHIDGQLIYDTDLFDRQTASRIADSWLQLLDRAAAGSAGPAARFEMITPAERHRQLTVWNATATERPFTAVHDQFKARAEQQPDRPAVSADGGVVSYGELDRWADAIADRCLKAGITPGDRVAVCAKPSATVAAAALGVLRAGACYVLIDPQLGPHEAETVKDLPEGVVNLLSDDKPPAVAP